jgi:TatD DNase family protein
MSVHARRAESAVLDLLEEFRVGPVVFHWYSGSLNQLDRLLKLGHACSVNVAMLRTERGKAILNRLPPERVLTETDGPFVRLSGEPIAPGQVDKVLEFLTSLWGMPEQEVSRRIRDNLRSFIPGQPPAQGAHHVR